MKSVLETGLRIAVFALIMLGLWHISVRLWSVEKVEVIDVCMDGRRVEAEGAAYFNGGLMTRLDWLAEVIGAELEQDGRLFTVRLGDDELVVKVGSSDALLNGERYKMDNAPLKEKGAVWVHTRTFMEAFGGSAFYGGESCGIYSPEVLAAMYTDQNLEAAQRFNYQPPQVYFNGVEVGGELKPVLVDNVWYVQDYALIKLLAAEHEMQVYPVFAPVKGKMEQQLNYFANTDWQETVSQAIIVTYPYSKQVLIKRGNELIGEEMERKAIPDKSQYAGGILYQLERLPEAGAADYPTNLSFAADEEGAYCFMLVPLKEFARLVVPDAAVEYDKKANELLITCAGSY